MNKNYDILIVGSGLTAGMIAYRNRGKKILVLERNHEPGGFCRTRKWNGINIHLYGTHIFHTDKKEVWDFVNSITPFIPFPLNVKATYQGKIYSLPFNMNTWNQIWGCTSIDEAKLKVKNNWSDVFKILIEGYSEKQWGRKCPDIPQEIFSRIPIRYTWDNNYHHDRYVGYPEVGYTEFIKKLLGNSEILYDTDYLKDKDYYNSLASEIYYTGPIDEFYEYRYGKLEWRSVDHVHKILDLDNFQGCPQMNYTDRVIPYTRIIEHKNFMPWVDTQGKTWISYEYSDKQGDPAYPVNDKKNNTLYEKYRSIQNDIHFCGRLAEYKYYNMNDIVEKWIKN